MRDFKNVFGAFLTGVAAGTILGFIFNPSYTREAKAKAEEEFSSLTKQFKEDIEAKYEDAREKLEEIKDSANRY